MPWNTLTITGARKAREAHARWKATPEGKEKRKASNEAYYRRNLAAIRERNAGYKRAARAAAKERVAQAIAEESAGTEL